MPIRDQALTMRSTAWLLTECAEHIKGRVFDVGCGSKPYKRLFETEEWTGLDIRSVGDLQADMDGFTSDPEYDCVLCVNALHHSRDPRAAFRNMTSAVKPGGMLIVSAPNVMWEDGKSYWRFGVSSLGMLCEENGLEVVTLGTYGGLFESEFEQSKNMNSQVAALPPELAGWVQGYLDKAYPMASWVIAKKKE
jgi:SAM-dependent methyltransferase